MTVNPYPLLWPDRHKRTPRERRARSAFRTTLETAAKDAARNLRNFGASDITITSNVKSDIAGTSTLVGQDPGVAVWFTKNKRQMCFCCDLYIDVMSNIRAIGLSIAALRDLERYNAQMFEQMMNVNNFDALPAQAGDGVTMYFSGCRSRSEVDAKWRDLAKVHHPDVGGDSDLMAEINRQYENAKQ